MRCEPIGLPKTERWYKPTCEVQTYLSEKDKLNDLPIPTKYMLPCIIASNLLAHCTYN